MFKTLLGHIYAITTRSDYVEALILFLKNYWVIEARQDLDV